MAAAPARIWSKLMVGIMALRRLNHARIPRPLSAAARPNLPVMSERLSSEVVAHVALLARLDLTDDELSLFTGQLAAVLEHAADVEALDLDDVPPTYHPLPLVNVLRDDEPRPGLDRDEVLAMAPDTEDRRFRVPRIMSEES